MSALNRISIKRKLLLVTLSTTAAALVLAGAGIVTLDAFHYRTALGRDLTALAAITADNSTAALDFQDRRVAHETLQSLRARTHMVTACLYRDPPEVFARYVRPGSDAACPAASTGAEVRADPGGLAVSQPIELQGRRIGTLTLLYDTGELTERVQLVTAVVGGVAVASILIAFVFSSRLRSAIATPISELAGAASSVSATADYSVRVRKNSEDEIGVLIDSFNGMLGTIEARDAEITRARNSFETTLSSIGDAVISTDANGAVVFANPVARNLLRWPDGDLLGRPVEDVFRIVHESTRERLESPVPHLLRDGAVAGPVNPTLLIARDGTEIPIDHSAAPIEHDGRIAGVVLVFRDITERRRARQESAYLAAIVHSTSDAIVGESGDGRIQSWNAGAERLYGYTREEALGQDLRRLLPAGRAQEEAGILERLRAGEDLVQFETQRLRIDGTVVDVSLTLSRILDRAGRFLGISHIARDITDQKRAAEQMRETQKLESLGVLAGGIAHDFNNLLTGILGNASLALGDLPLHSPSRSPIEAVLSASERAAQLAQQMLAYSGKGRFILEHLDLSARVRDTARLIRASVPPNVDLRLRLADRLPLIEADTAQIQQVVMNIIINAAEAVPEGRPGRVTVVTRRERVDRPGLEPGEYVVFEVSDDGVGMDAETRARIFDPFFTTKFTGRGLGMAAVLGIVRGHRGAIDVQSSPGAGTTFVVLFPAMHGDLPPVEAPPQAVEARPFARGGCILVVDDEPVVRNLAYHALRRFGYTVLTAENGALGVDLLHSEADRIRCVVLDLTMPVMSGEEALSRMREAHPRIPVILSSGFNEAQAVRQFEGKGLAGFLQKPYTAGRLLNAVESVIAQAEANAAHAS
jgi:PAS domain S-box-containing protein